MFKQISTLALLAGLALPLAMVACTDDGDGDGDDTSTGDGDGDTSGDGDGDPTGDGDGDPTGDGDGDGDTTGDGDGDTTGDGDGFCGLACEAVEDCDLGLGTDGWSCDEGFCMFEVPACDPDAPGDVIDFTDCFGQPANCVPVDGVNTCVQVPGCADDQACEDAFLAGYTCTGADDNAQAYCEPPEPEPFVCTPGEACEGGYGVCNDAGDACVCMDDEQCTAEGTA